MAEWEYDGYNCKSFLASDTFVVPAGVTLIDVLVIAGGGGGGRSNSYSAGGGGAGDAEI